MITLSGGSISALGDAQENQAVPKTWGEFDLVGEIVDSKCYFGNMNPGNGKVHRDCAVRCMSGGIPLPSSLRMTSTDLLQCCSLTGPNQKPLPNEAFPRFAWPNQCGFMEGSRRSAIHCFWRRNRLPFLLEVFGVHLSTGDNSDRWTISGRSYSGLQTAHGIAVRSWLNEDTFRNQACHELDEIPLVVQPFVIDWTAALSSTEFAQCERSGCVA